MLLNCLRLHFSLLNEQKFLDNFRATIDPMCSRGLESEATLHYFLCCNLSTDFKQSFFNGVSPLNRTFKNLFHEKLSNILLYESEDFSFSYNNIYNDIYNEVFEDF